MAFAEATEAAQIGLKPHAGVFSHDHAETSQIGPVVTQNVPTLADCEADIAEGGKAFVKVGRALAAVKEMALYTGQYPSWDEYLAKRWPRFKARRAEQYIQAAKFMNKLFTDGSEWPLENEGHVRKVASANLSPAEAEIFRIVLRETTTDGKVTAAHIESLIEVFRTVLKTRAIPGDDGEDIPLDAAQLIHSKVAIAEETIERYRRYVQEIEQISRWTAACKPFFITSADGLEAAFAQVRETFEKTGAIKLNLYVKKQEDANGHA